MNYIKEINAFYDWLETNSVSDSAITLWHALMHINNKAGWKVEFTVASSVLCLKSGLSNSSFKRARNILKQSGRIEWRERKGNQSAVYNIKTFAVHIDPQSEPLSEPQTGPQSEPLSEPINKLNYTKLNNNILLEKESKEKKIEKDNSESDFDSEMPNAETQERKKVAQKKERFKPPSVDAVQAYCNERQNGIQAFKFVNFYQSKGWKVGNQAMKDWKAAIRTWEQKNKENGQSNNNNSNKGFSSYSGNTTMGKGGKKSTAAILAQRARDKASGNGYSGNFTDET